jgi:hypothetical protein
MRWKLSHGFFSHFLFWPSLPFTLKANGSLTQNELQSISTSVLLVQDRPRVLKSRRLRNDSLPAQQSVCDQSEVFTSAVILFRKSQSSR